VPSHVATAWTVRYENIVEICHCDKMTGRNLRERGHEDVNWIEVIRVGVA